MTDGSPNDGAIASVVVPAHNEAAVIGRLLDSLWIGAKPGRFEVVVACNACTDDTAEIARRRGATVVEIDVASKIAALNAGDRVATAFPRCYVDADIEVTGSAIEEVARVLSEDGGLCAALPFRLNMSGRPWPVRAYFAVWALHPYVVDRYVGSGFYALSEHARERFDRFPELVADDLFIRNSFVRVERRVADSVPFVVHAPWTLRSLLRRRIRIYAGNMELRDHPEYRALPGGQEPSAPWWRAVVENPTLALSAIVYVAVNTVAKLAARRVRRQGTIDWGRDETTRSVLPAGNRKATPTHEAAES